MPATPEHIKRNGRCKSLLIYGGDSSNLLALCNSFPFAHYKLEGWAGISEPCLYSGKDENDLLKSVDAILLLDNSFESSLKIIINNLDARPIIITHKECSIEGVGSGYVFDFGGVSKSRPIICITPARVGLMWHFSRINRIVFSRKDCIFYVDMQNFKNQLISPQDLGFYNPWNYYFVNYCNYDAESVYDGGKVYIINCTTAPRITSEMPLDRSFLSKGMTSYENTMFKDVFRNRKKVLGVFLRGTDYRVANWHQMPMDPYEAANVAKQFMESYGLKYVFIDTEDEHNFEVFKNIFGDKLIYLERDRFKDGQPMPLTFAYTDSFQSLITGRDYLTETLLVSRCPVVLSSSGSSALYIRQLSEARGNKFFMILSKQTIKSQGPNTIKILSFTKNRLDSHNTLSYSEFGISVSSSGDSYLVTGTPSCDVDIVLFNSNPFIDFLTNYYFGVFGDHEGVYDLHLNYSDGRNAVHTEGPFTADGVVISSSVLGHYKKDTKYNEEVRFQIDRSLVKSSYEPYNCSTTEFAIKDVNGVFYKADYVKYICLSKGVFSIGSKVLSLDKKELSLANNIVLYNNGYIKYDISGNYYDNLYFSDHKSQFDEEDAIDTWFLNESFYSDMGRPYYVRYMKSLMYAGYQGLAKKVFAKCLDNKKYPEIE